MSSWTIQTLSELIFSVNDEDDPIDAILCGCLGSVKELIESIMEAERDIFCGIGSFKRGCTRKDYRNGYYERDFESCFGVLRKLRIWGARQSSILATDITFAFTSSFEIMSTAFTDLQI